MKSEKEALGRLPGFSPEVIVSGYHLRGSETGAGVVAAVRAHLGTFASRASGALKSLYE